MNVTLLVLAFIRDSAVANRDLAYDIITYSHSPFNTTKTANHNKILGAKNLQTKLRFRQSS